MRSLPALIRRIQCGGSLSQYRGDDWKEYVYYNQKTLLYRDHQNSLSLVSTDCSSLLPTGEVLVLQGHLRLLDGKRLREGEFCNTKKPVSYDVEEQSVYLELEK
jgi:hypothetical protein